MNARQSVILSILVLVVLRTGISVLVNAPPWIITITIPAWLIAAGAGLLFLFIVLWLRANLWLIAPDVERAAHWLADDSAPLLTDERTPMAYTQETIRLRRER